MTVHNLKRHVPALVPGIVFLSGGQSEVQATENLNAINRDRRAVAALVLVRPCAPGVRARRVAWRGGQRRGSAGGLPPPGAHEHAAAVAGRWSRDAERRMPASARRTATG